MAEKEEKSESSHKVEVKDEDSDDTKVQVSRKNTAFSGPMAISPEDLDNKAIDDIARTETEKAMKAEDEKIAEEFVKKKSFKEKLNDWFHSWWDNPKKRYTVLGITAFLLLFLAIFPPTRYAALNTVGVRATASVVVLDESTGQPLKNVDVTIQEKVSQTDIHGRATIEKVRLGSTDITVNKVAYAESVNKQTIGMGNNVLSDVSLTPIGSQFSFKFTDWLSGNPITNGEVSFKESSAVTNEEGVAVLTIEPVDETEITTTVKADGYRDAENTISTISDEENQAKMVVGEPNYFVSNRSGRYDVYKGYINEEPTVIVGGSGSERDDIRFAVSPDRKYGVLVSTRDGNRNEDGFLFSGLYKVNLEDSQLSKLDESERIDIIGWVDGKLVYVKVAAGASGKNPERHRLIIRNLDDDSETQIAASNYFNDIVVTHNKVFYAPSDAYKDNPDAALFMSDSSGNITKVHESEVWTIFQSEFDQLTYDAVGDWYKYSISENTAFLADGPPNDRTSKLFIPGPENKYAWVDQRDGKGVLLIYDTNTRESDTITSLSGLRYPVQWISDKHIVFRVVDSAGSADYVVNVEGGEPQKINNVSNVPGTDRWYFYY